MRHAGKAANRTTQVRPARMAGMLSSRRAADLSILAIAAFAILSAGLALWVFQAYQSISSASILTLQEANQWRRTTGFLDYLLDPATGDTTPISVIKQVQDSLGRNLEHQRDLQDQIKALLTDSRSYRILLVTSEEEEDTMASLFVSREVFNRLSEAAEAPEPLIRTNLSHWSVQFVFSVQSGQVLDPVFQRSNLLEDIRGRTVRKIWQIFAFSLVGFMVIILFVWRSILNPTIRNLAATRAEMQVLLDNIPVAVCGVGPDYRVLSANTAFRKLRNITKQDLQAGKQVEELVGPVNWPTVQDRLAEAFGGKTVSFDMLYATNSGDQMISVTYAPLVEADGSVSLVIVCIANIHSRYQTEKALRISEENLRITLDSIGDAVIATDRQGRITRMNPIAESLTGWRAGEAVGQSLSEVFVIRNSQTGDPVPSPVDRVLEAGNIVGLANHTALRSRSGVDYQITDSGAPIRDATGQIVGVVLVFRDVTDDYLRERRISTSEKMQAIGQLAGGIAHDFNNSLAAILGAVELIELHDSSKFSDKSKRLIGQIIRAAEQSSELIEKLTAFARVAEYSRSDVDLADVIEDTLELLKNTIDRRISVSFQNSAANTHALGNASSLQAVFMNIGLNAIQAMPDGGSLDISMENCSLTHKDIQKYPNFDLRTGEHVRVRITDTGTGISSQLLPRIFDPFFTTKSNSEGTGLGLAAALGTVQDHHGAIFVTTQVNKGTTFTILLPSVTATAQPGTPEPEIQLPAENPDRSATILLVEDEDDLRDVGASILSALGHRVLTAVDGDDAVRVFSLHRHDIHLVLLDINMPNKDGAQALAEMKQIDPQVMAVIVTGFAEEAQSKAFQDPNVFATLRKPYTMKKLQQTLSAALVAADRINAPEPPQTA